MALERRVTGMAYQVRLVLRNRPAVLSITHKFPTSKIQKILKINIQSI